MTISRIILLTGEVEAPILSGLLRDQNPAVEIVTATTNITPTSGESAFSQSCRKKLPTFVFVLF